MNHYIEDFVQQIKTSSNQTLFLYIIIIVFIIVIFRRFNISLSIILAIFIAIIVIVYINTNNTLNIRSDEEIFQDKVNTIKPTPINIQKYPKFVDFIFGIQDMYQYNVPAYEQMIDSIDFILDLYEEAKINNQVAGSNYEIIDHKRIETTGNLQSIIYNLPTNTIYINKLNDSIEYLDDLIIELLDEVYSLNQLYIFNNGYNIETKIINMGPKSYNFYDNNFNII